jgi:hypothetical protein
MRLPRISFLAEAHSAPLALVFRSLFAGSNLTLNRTLNFEHGESQRYHLREALRLAEASCRVVPEHFSHDLVT